MTPAEIKARVLWVQNHPVWDLSEDRPSEYITKDPWQWCIDMDHVWVNPDTDEIDDDESLNTSFRVWIEAGPWGHPPEMAHPCHTHDLRLDCGGKSVPDAFLELADLVEKYYNDDGSEKPFNWDAWLSGQPEEAWWRVSEK
tara:strand:- start:5572 stop:5994 length:423 start_codon:yes stop_codon:yes gene_type:complete